MYCKINLSIFFIVFQVETNQHVLSQKNGNKVWSFVDSEFRIQNLISERKIGAIAWKHIPAFAWLWPFFIIFKISEWNYQTRTNQWFDKARQHNLLPEKEAT